jgi:hypothetical protein
LPASGANQTRTIAVAGLAIAAVALTLALRATSVARSSAPTPRGSAAAVAGFVMATCSGSVAESPDEEFWKVPLDKCDSAIDAIDVKSGFVTKWSICGGAKSFEVSLNPAR